MSLLLGALALTGLLVMSNTDPVASLDGAEWLRDPAFQGLAVIDIAHKQKDAPPELSGPQNVHTYFRKEFALNPAPVKATLRFTADDYAKVYINGTPVSQGPEPCYPFAQAVLSVDVTPHLKAGANCLALHAYYQGLRNRVWNSADSRSGILAILDVTLSDGSKQRIVTDGTWRCLRSEAFPTGDVIGYDTQFLENIDMRRIPEGWREPGFDDSAWSAPLVERQDHVFVPSMIPPLEHGTAKPARVHRVDDGHYVYDFGAELVGHTRIRLKGPEGHVVEVRHAEEGGPDGIRYELRANCRYQESITLSGSEDTIAFYDYKGFRYVEILNAPAEPEVWVDVRHYPFDPAQVSFASSDELLNSIWTLCVDGVRMGSQGGYLDCPTREKGQYLGDALIAGHSQMLLTADARLARKALQDFAHSQRVCPGIMAVAPGSFMQEIAEYSLQYPLLLHDYYRLSGDRYFTYLMARQTLPKLFDCFEGYENEHGLITGMSDKWVLVDWPANLRDDYDYEFAKSRECAVVNAFYYAALDAAAEICDAVELGGSNAYREKAERVRKAFVERMTDPITGLFVDAPGSSHTSLHANALPLAFGMTPQERVPAALDLIREKGLSCGVYIAPFVLQACYRAGDSELAYSLLTNDGPNSWAQMLKAGATTCMEVWDPSLKGNASFCHPWSSSPIYIVVEAMLGLTPEPPGWRSVRFAPRVPEGLDHAELTLPIPQGRITVRYDRSRGFDLIVPLGVGVKTDVTDGTLVHVVSDAAAGPGELSPEQQAVLNAYEWDARVGANTGVWISVDEQLFRIVEGGRILWEVPCATATKGTGSKSGSYQTPLGWHSVRSKTGDGKPWGQVFRSGEPTGEMWTPGVKPKEDLVLTRILFLQGEEPGKNRGGNVDSFERKIYIHGTNGEDVIGTPSSHGCIRLRNDDVITAYDRIPTGTPVLITEGPVPRY